MRQNVSRIILVMILVPILIIGCDTYNENTQNGESKEYEKEQDYNLSMDYNIKLVPIGNSENFSVQNYTIFKVDLLSTSTYEIERFIEKGDFMAHLDYGLKKKKLNDSIYSVVKNNLIVDIYNSEMRDFISSGSFSDELVRNNSFSTTKIWDVQETSVSILSGYIEDLIKEDGKLELLENHIKILEEKITSYESLVEEYPNYANEDISSLKKNLKIYIDAKNKLIESINHNKYLNAKSKL